MAARLPDGNTLISAQDEVIELNTSGSIAWRWPPQVVSTTDEISVRNPASGTDLSVHVHRPAAPPDSSVALAVVLVPDGLEPGTVYDSIGLAADLAEAGFVVLHFDPDGRGRSVPGVEDYDGPIHQSGLQACVAWLAGLAYVDPRRIGIYSRGYGITMSSGMVARSTGAPAAFLLDDEGLADRHQASADSGGPVPVPPDSAAFWDVREAARYLKQVPVAYLRMQTETDRGGRLFDNRHAIALIDSATSLVHGGSGLSPWTRVNDSVMNPANRTYTLADPPAWIPEQEETYQADVRILAYLQELALFSAPTALAGPAPSRPRDSRLRASPNPSHGPVRLDFRLDRSGASNLTVQDAAGRVVQTLAAGNMTAGSHFRIWNPAVPAGMYFVTLQAAGSAGCARVVVR
jgi:hypothetical protein